MESALYIVATPIGNLADISLRALEVLKQVNWVAAEDTRHSKRLFKHYNISTPALSLHEHNEQQRITKILQLLEQGQSVALISDAGTPLISDPGYRVVLAVKEAGFAVIPIPGACSVIAALSVSGLPTDKFVFEGFLPAKGEKRIKRLNALVNETRTLIFFESVHRIVEVLELMVTTFGKERLACLAREITKTYETIKRAPLAELCAWIKSDVLQQKGEYVVIVAGQSEEISMDAAKIDHLLETLLAELPLSRAVKVAQKLTGLGRHTLYQRALILNN